MARKAQYRTGTATGQDQVLHGWVGPQIRGCSTSVAGTATFPTMSLWSAPNVGVIVGGAIAAAAQFGTQWWGNWRETKREGRNAAGQARAERDALQVRTLADLQEQLEAVSVMFGGEAARPVKAAMFRNLFTADNYDIPDLTPYSRTVMLCSRLHDQELASAVRAWLKDVRITLSQMPLTSEAIFALRDRRVGLQDRLGERLLSYYQ